MDPLVSTISGTLGRDAGDWVYLPVDVPPGAAGFRGWSAGARTRFFISAAEATPGYLPGLVNPGRWHVLLAPYHVAPDGLTYEVDVRFTIGPDDPTPSVAYPPQRIGTPGTRWVRGDCHLHTVYSDGVRTPEQMAAAARAGGRRR